MRIRVLHPNWICVTRADEEPENRIGADTKGAHLWMAGWTTLRVAHPPTHRPLAAHKLHQAPPPSGTQSLNFHSKRRGTLLAAIAKMAVHYRNA